MYNWWSQIRTWPGNWSGNCWCTHVLQDAGNPLWFGVSGKAKNTKSNEKKRVKSRGLAATKSPLRNPKQRKGMKKKRKKKPTSPVNTLMCRKKYKQQQEENNANAKKKNPLPTWQRTFFSSLVEQSPLPARQRTVFSSLACVPKSNVVIEAFVHTARKVWMSLLS